MDAPWDVEALLRRNMDLTANQDMTLYAVQHLLPGCWAKTNLQKEQPQSLETLLGKDEKPLENIGKMNPT